MTTLDLHLPRPHSAQAAVIAAARRYNVAACGRRFGKTRLGIDRIIRPALEGRPVGWFSPTYKMLTEVWRDLAEVLKPVTSRQNVAEHRLELITGGVLDMWSLDAPDAVRGRKYSRVVIDEAAMVPDLANAWQAAIRPTLTDLKGDAWFLSTPKGMNFFWQAFVWGQSEEHEDWASWHMPTTANPFIDPAEVEDARRQLPERVYQQEYLAQFLEDSGSVFRCVREAVDAGRMENEAPASTAYSMGVDLARIEDFTVIAILDYSGRQVYFERFNQISWERQVQAIESAATRYQARVQLDSTGVGDPILEALQRRGIYVEGVNLTNTSKEQMIDGLAMALEQSELRLMDIPDQTNELLAYQYELTAARNVRMNAPVGMHDDCVIALALAQRGRGLGGNSSSGLLTSGKRRESLNV